MCSTNYYIMISIFSGIFIIIAQIINIYEDITGEKVDC